MDILENISQSLQNGEPDTVAELTGKALDDGVPVKELLHKGLLSGMEVVGERFKAHEIFLPDVLLAAKAMYAGMEVLKPLMVGEEAATSGTVVIGTVQGDLHDIGKNLVGIMLRGAGFNVVDLGKDVPPERFIEEAQRTGARVIGMSALLTTTMPVMGLVVNLARERGLLGKVKIIVGGAPLSDEYAQQIGADAYCFDGMNAVDCVKGFLGIN
ncbi:MAG: corrinoid protein [Candidatus Zixiibacteriota bacterium]|nr:MAG: corrinoid protein [candidate division Zixibacteria bacterium]